MRTLFFLKTCNTCIRIQKELNLPATIELRELKSKPITAHELEALVTRSGSYESLFNRRSKLYTSMGLKHEVLQEKDYRHYILDHYSFLKRPVLVIDDKIYIGNSKNEIEGALNHLSKL
jgi:arsenate reductase